MAEIFSQLSLIYRFDNVNDGLLKIIRNNTNADNTGNDATILNSSLVVPPSEVNKFEMRVTATGDTARITQNSFANWRVLGTSPGSVTHRLVKDDEDPPGTISGSVTLSVTVRRIAYPSDAVSGTVVLNNSLTANITPVSNWDGNLNVGGTYMDSGVLDSRNVEALTEFLFESSGTVKLRRNYPTAIESVIGNWTGTFANAANTEIRAIVVSGDSPGSSTMSDWVQLNITRSLSYFSGYPDAFGGAAEKQGVIEFQLREIGNPATTITKQAICVVSLSAGDVTGVVI